jgi:thiamine kinase-like enzyme
MNADFDFHSIIQQFQIEGDLQDVVAYGEGHINLTYAIALRERGGNNRRYILQCINHEVFKNPEAVMQNIERVTGHIRRAVTAAGEDTTRKTITLVPTSEGTHFYKSPSGEYWRVTHFLEGARTYQKAVNSQHYYNAGHTFGKFIAMLHDFPASQLYETIPDFHNTPKRYQDFLKAVKRDPVNRAFTIKPEIKFALGRESETRVLMDLSERGVIPERVTHNDTKIDNVMIDDETGEGVCVIDLDTVMPGLSVFDFGDSVRSGANQAAEDEPDISKVAFDLDVFDTLAQGFLDATREMLTVEEVQHLALGAKLITFEQAVRFLTDYLNGDIYYRTHRPNQNLDRARTQIKMVVEMEEKYEEMEATILKYR